MQSLKFYIEHPNILEHVLLEQISPLLSDRLYVQAKWHLNMGDRKLNLENPQTFNEKLNWLKLYDHNPIYTTMVDKYRVKQFVAERIGDEHVVPLLGVWNTVGDIEWDKLPKQFVIKCSHDCGGMIICRDKSKLNLKKARTILKKKLRKQYYWKSREWPYKNVDRRIFAEAYMEDEYGELRDYKWFCFDGEPKALFISANRQKAEETTFDFFDANFNHLPFTNGHPNSITPFIKPKGFETMKKIAAKLSEGIPQVRIDLYNVNGAIYFGEFTFFHWGGMKPFVPEEWDYTFGSWIKLPQRKQ